MDNLTNNTDKLGNCSKCGQCCGLFIPITKQEVKLIKEYVTEHNIKPVNRETSKGFEAHCCFLDKDNHKCLIYEVRPYVCRNFICSRKDWKTYREKYDKLGEYNSTINNRTLAAFDDLIYQDYNPIIRYLLNIVYQTTKGKVDSKDIVKTFKYFNRLDLLHYISAEDENGNKINGEDMLKEI